MKRFILFTMFILIMSTIGCKKSFENNNSLEFDKIDVNFKGESADKAWPDGDEIGIFSTCTHDEVEDVPMSVNVNAKYVAKNVEGEGLYFVKASDNDRIIAAASDYNFKFYAYYPYSSNSTDMSSISVQVPSIQNYSQGVGSYGLYVANKQVTTVIPTIKLDFKGIFSTIELNLPNEILNENGNSIIKSLILKPAIPGNFDGTLANGGTYNLKTGIFTSNANMQANSVKIDFGGSGITLVNAFTKVSMAVSPFTVPLGGMEVVIADLLGNEKTVKLLNREEDEGKIIAAGEVLTQYLSSDNDGIIPVTFPVVFPLGKTNNVPNFTAATQSRWVGEGIWTSPTQSQAYGQWRKVSDPSSTTSQFLEPVNSGNVSSPGIKGIWTGDHLEFSLPVKKFAAGTGVTIKFPIYTRQGPVFWKIEYFDNGEWKSNTTNITSYDPAYTREATFSLIRGGKIIEHTMVFTEEIKSGHLKIRITCADGSIQADTDTKVAVRNTPWISSAAYGAPFYFHLEGSEVTSITFSIN